MLTSSYEDDMNTDFKTDSFFVNLFIGLVAITIFLNDTNDLFVTTARNNNESMAVRHHDMAGLYFESRLHRVRVCLGKDIQRILHPAHILVRIILLTQSSFLHSKVFGTCYTMVNGQSD